MSMHYVNAHKGEDHVSSDDSRVTQATVLGSGRYVVSGFGVSKTANNVVHIADGLALIDGGWLRMQGGGMNIGVPDGSLGMKRTDVLFLVFVRDAEGIESMDVEYVTGDPHVSSPMTPTNPHPGSILEGDSEVWIPLMTVSLSGFTVGNPVAMLPQWTMPATTPGYAQYEEQVRRITAALAECGEAIVEAHEEARIASALIDQMQALVRTGGNPRMQDFEPAMNDRHDGQVWFVTDENAAEVIGVKRWDANAPGSGLFPDTGLYPADYLYPQNMGEWKEFTWNVA